MKRLITASVLVALTGCTTLQYDPLLKLTHISDITRGYPEPTSDYIGTGVTITYKQLEVDLSHGLKSRDCAMMRGRRCYWESGSELSMRFYPWGRN